MQVQNQFTRGRLIAFSILAGFLAVILLLPVNALAAKPTCGKGKLDPCPGQTLPDDSETVAWFDDSVFFTHDGSLPKTLYKTVFGIDKDSTADGGDYLANINPSNQPHVDIDLSNLEEEHSSKKYHLLCHIFLVEGANFDGFSGKPTEFNYGWTDSCADSRGCTVEIRMLFEGENVRTQITSAGLPDVSNKVEIVMQTQLESPGPNFPDPFQQDVQPVVMDGFDNLGIEVIDVIFYKTGTTRKAEDCTFIAPQGAGTNTTFYSQSP